MINIDNGVKEAKLATVDWKIYLIPRRLNKDSTATQFPSAGLVAPMPNKARIPLNNMANPIKIIKVIMGFKDTLSFLFCIIIT